MRIGVAMTINSFNKSIVKKNQKIVIYGSGVYGEIALRTVETLGLNVEAFVDRASGGKTYLGKQVIYPEQLVDYENDIIIIASLNYFYDMVANLQEMGMANYYDMIELLSVDVKEGLLSEYALDEKGNPEKYINVVRGGMEGVIVGHCEVVVTERCSLRCKDCANLMQYYMQPENLDVDEIINTFDRFLSVVDTLLELRILGGEPFVCQELDKILERYVKEDKIKKITIYTNSTIVPSDKILNSMKNSKVSVHMSDYGVNSRKIVSLENALIDNSIRYYIHRYEKWHDLGDLSNRNYSSEVMKQVYQTCVMGKCYTFYRGKLYLCPRAAHGERLGYFENDSEEYIDFSDGKISKDVLRERVVNLINNIEAINACNYCNGSNTRSKEVVAAVQM